MRDVDLLFDGVGGPLVWLFVKIDLIFILLDVHKALKVSQSIVGLLFWHFSSDSTFASDNVALTLEK